MSQMFDPSIDESQGTIGNMVTFYMRSVLDKKRTQETGLDHFMEQEWVKIKVRGDHTMELDVCVTDKHREEYASSYRRFKEGTDQRIGDGFPLEQWPVIGKPMVQTLHGMDVFTVEQLAEFPDTMIHRVHQGQTYKQKAIKWLAERNGGGDVADLRAEVERLTAVITKMKAAPVRKKRRKYKARKKTPVKPAETNLE